MSKFGSVWMKNLQPVVASVGDALDADHLLHIGHAPPADNRHEHVRHVAQSSREI